MFVLQRVRGTTSRSKLYPGISGRLGWDGVIFEDQSFTYRASGCTYSVIRSSLGFQPPLCRATWSVEEALILDGLSRHGHGLSLYLVV